MRSVELILKNIENPLFQSEYPLNTVDLLYFESRKIYNKDNVKNNFRLDLLKKGLDKNQKKSVNVFSLSILRSELLSDWSAA